MQSDWADRSSRQPGNYQAATISRIQDVDAARASSDLFRQRILPLAGTALLAQANISPQSAIELLD